MKKALNVSTTKFIPPKIVKISIVFEHIVPVIKHLNDNIESKNVDIPATIEQNFSLYSSLKNNDKIPPKIKRRIDIKYSFMLAYIPYLKTRKLKHK